MFGKEPAYSQTIDLTCWEWISSSGNVYCWPGHGHVTKPGASALWHCTSKQDPEGWQSLHLFQVWMLTVGEENTPCNFFFQNEVSGVTNSACTFFGGKGTTKFITYESLSLWVHWSISPWGVVLVKALQARHADQHPEYLLISAKIKSSRSLWPCVVMQLAWHQ